VSMSHRTLNAAFAISIMISTMFLVLSFALPIDLRAALLILLVVHVVLYAWGTK
jgi:hypothetical protein